MNAERIKQLDRAWSVYKGWVMSLKGEQLFTFAEWLHCEYEKARKENVQ